jgi:HEAT repeat protein
MQQSNPKTATIYFSYAGHDAAFAFQLAADLKNAGFELWIEQFDNQPEANRLATISDKLSQCALMVPVLSAHYIDNQSTWFDLEQLTSTTNVPILPVLLHDWGLPEWVHLDKMINFSRWTNTFIYQRSLNQFIATLKDNYIIQPQSQPDAEIRYINQLTANIERYKSYLNTVSPRNESLPTDKRALYSRSLWGLTGEFEVTSGNVTQTKATYQFSEIMNTYPRFVLISAAGAGKTTTLYRTLLDTFRAYQSSKADFPLPLLLHLGQWTENVSFETFLNAQWPLDNDPAPLLTEGRVLLLLDGLDEIGNLRTEKTTSLHMWLQGNKSAKYVVVACNKRDYSNDMLELPIVHLKAINSGNIRQHVTQHIGEDAANQLLSQIIPDNQEAQVAPQVARLAGNAFYLAIMIAITQKMPEEMLPKHEAGLLKWLVESLWTVKNPSDNFIPLEIALPALSLLAFSMVDENTPACVSNEYVLQKIGEDPILQFALDTGILQMSNGMVRFCHQLVRDYCATYWLTTEEGVYTRLMRAQFTPEGERTQWKWDHIVILCSALAPDPDMFVSGIAEANPYLALECIANGTIVSEDVQREVTQNLLSFLHTTDRDYVSQIMHLMEAVTDGETLSTLLEYLHHNAYSQNRHKNEDPTMPIKKLGTNTVHFLINILKRDQQARRRGAAWALGEIQEPAAVPSLIDALRDKDESVRKEADYALARIGQAALPSLLKKLHEKDPDLRAAIIKVLGRIGDPRAVPDLVACLPDTSWPHNEDVRVCDLAAIALEHISSEDAQAAIDTWREQVRVAAANSEWHARVRAGAQSAPTTKAVDQLLQDLKNEEWSTRRDAVRLLGESGDDAAIPHILSTLKDSDSQVRWMAVKTLDQFQGEAVIKGLLEAMRDEDHLTYDAAAIALSKRGDTAVAGLIEALSDTNINVRGNAAEALGNIGSEAAIPHLVDALDDTERPQWEDIRICDIAAAALGKIGTKQSLLALEKWQQTSPHAPQIETKPLGEYTSLLQLDYAYAQIETDPRYNALVKFLDTLQESEWQDRRKAVESLQEYAGTLRNAPDSEAIAKLASALHDDETLVRWTAAEALATIGDTTATPALLAALHDKSWTVRAAAVRALSEIDSDEAMPGLLETINDPNSFVRETTVAILGKVGNSAVAQQLLGALQDTDSFVRRAAARTLGQIADKAIVPDLLELLDDENDAVRWATIESLGKIGDPDAIPALVKKLQDAHKPALESKPMCDLAAEALQAIGTSEALAAIERWRTGSTAPS